MAAVSRLRSSGSALLVVLTGLGGVLLWGGAVLADHAAWGDPSGGPGPGLALLLAASGLTWAAMRPDRWAPLLSRSHPGARVLLVLGLSLLALPLGGSLFLLFCLDPGSLGQGLSTVASWGLPVALGALPAAVAVLRSRRSPSPGGFVTLAALIAVLGTVLALSESLAGPPHATVAAAHRAFVDSFGPARTLDVPATEGAAGHAPSPDDGLDPSGVDTMVERHSRGAAERPVERRLDISRSQQALTLDLVCESSARCRAAVSSPARLRGRFSLPIDPRSPIELRQDGPRGLMLLSNAGHEYVIASTTGESYRVSLLELRPWLRLPLVWRLAPLAVWPLLLGLGLWRRRARDWQAALAAGRLARVHGGWLRGPGGLEAPTDLRDGPAVLLAGHGPRATYRAMTLLPPGAAVAGRRPALVERARLNVQVLDATALLLASLAAAPLVAARLASLLP